MIHSEHLANYTSLTDVTDKWRKLEGNRLLDIIQGIEFRDGIKQFPKIAGKPNPQLSGIALLDQQIDCPANQAW